MTDTSHSLGGGPARIGVSSCLLGHNTRHDGGNRLDMVVVDLVESIAEPVAVCPEMEIGMGSPRPPIQLVKMAGGIRATGVDDPSLDVTLGLERAGRLQGELSGLILKSRSPSCGAGSSSVFFPDGALVSSSGLGVFARAVTRSFPLMPIVEETALHDPSLRKGFILQVFVYDLALRAISAEPGGFRKFSEKTMFIAEGMNDTARDGLQKSARRRESDNDPRSVMDHAAALMKGLAESFPDHRLAATAERAAFILSGFKRGTYTGGR